ncbi:MAG: prolipoprotein diacylglyceryl transferase, partial [Bacillota bacterium]
MNPIAIKIGSYPIYWYGIIMSTAILLGSLLAAKRAEKENLDSDHIFNLIIIVIPAAFIMARLYYVVFEWPQYAGNWKEIIAIWHGGLAIHGGLIGGFLAGFFYVKWQKLPFWKFADIIAPSIILGQAIGRWGNFFNQEAHG